MIDTTIGITKEFGWCVLAVGAACFSHLYGSAKVGMARKVWLPQMHSACRPYRTKYGIKYPQMYAEKSDEHHKEFNCVQRAHQNTLEWLPMCQILTLANGLVYPITSAALLGVWTVGRIFYIQGYGSGRPENRMFGAMVSHLGDLPLIVMTFFAAYKVLA